jgi:S1-C subfamily serine protease
MELEASSSNEGIPWDEFALCTVRSARGKGTGFALSKPNWFVTAKHVVSGQPLAQPIQLLFGEGLVLPARVLFVHPRLDVAVLEVVGDTRCRAPFMPSQRGPISSELLYVGYQPSMSDRNAGRYIAFVRAVHSYERTTRQRDGYEECLFIFPAPRGEPGRSGSPLLASRGSVIGVVVDGIMLGGRHMMRATSILPVLDHLALATPPEAP